MASTSLYMPAELIEQLDRVAEEEGTSRSKLIVRACRELLRTHHGDWPEGFFDRDDLSPRDLEELEAGAEALRAAIEEARSSKREPPF